MTPVTTRIAFTSKVRVIMPGVYTLDMPLV